MFIAKQFNITKIFSIPTDYSSMNTSFLGPSQNRPKPEEQHYINILRLPLLIIYN